jgi:c-di-GMP-binding flagellar brake protein YcgR
MGEKRKYMRFNVLMDAICRTGGALKKLKISDFSKEGVGVLSNEAFEEGENVEMELMIPGDNVPVILQGEVAWAKSPFEESVKYKSGVKFKNMTNGDKSRILEYIYQKWIMPADAEK